MRLLRFPSITLYRTLGKVLTTNLLFLLYLPAQAAPSQTTQPIPRQVRTASPQTVPATIPPQVSALTAAQQAAKYKELGEAAYEAKNYTLAVAYYTKALSLLPHDAAQNLADLYYVRAMANDVTGQYQRATADWQAARDNYAKALLGNKAGVNVEFATSYRDELNELVHWRAAQSPSSPDYCDSIHSKRLAPGSVLKVYISQSKKAGFSPELRTYIFQAMNLWCQFPGSPIRMELWPTQYDSNIVVQRATADDPMNIGSAGQTSSYGRELVTKSFVNLSAPSYDSKDMTPRAKEQLFNLALHETGHALGIDGHSPSGLDVMYFKSPLIKLSDRDANTIRKIYQ
ncbi:MAG: matrixin family metalloprotease [Candidatus Melainabacteria bacterium]|nr:matrixin family metalloprotease [Candidatus Melainabacteria bacterium]